MSDEVNVIDHLLDVERNASQLVMDAQAEAAKRITSARVEADSEYKKQYSLLSQKLEDEYQARVAELGAEHDKALDEYKNNVQSAEKDEKSFNSFLESVLFSA